MTEEQKRKKRERERERQNGNSLKSVEEVTPQIVCYFHGRVISSGCIFLKSGLVVFSFVQE